MWIVVLAVAACIAAGCGGSPSAKNSTRASAYLHALEHHASTTTTTTTHGGSTTGGTAASGPNDKAACSTFASIGTVAHSSHQAIATYFRRLFVQLHKAESPYLRSHGHSAAEALILGHAKKFKKAFYDVYLECNKMGVK
jgi:hypothetical protein